MLDLCDGRRLLTLVALPQLIPIGLVLSVSVVSSIETRIIIKNFLFRTVVVRLYHHSLVLLMKQLHKCVIGQNISILNKLFSLFFQVINFLNMRLLNGSPLNFFLMQLLYLDLHFSKVLFKGCIQLYTKILWWFNFFLVLFALLFLQVVRDFTINFL